MEIIIIIIIIAIVVLFNKVADRTQVNNEQNDKISAINEHIKALQRRIYHLEKSKAEQNQQILSLKQQLNQTQSPVEDKIQIDKIQTNTQPINQLVNQELENQVENIQAHTIQANTEANSINVPSSTKETINLNTASETPPPIANTDTDTHTNTSHRSNSEVKATPSQPKKDKAEIRKPKPAKPSEPSLLDKAVVFAKNWLTTGNIPVKIGMLVLIAAVIALLRYATTMGWIHVPIEAKHIGIALSALGALVFAWTKRTSKPSFSLSVQGGSIGIVLLTLFSAVKMYSLISSTAGFIMSVLMILLMAILAIKQDAKILAVMAVFAGFLAPIWLSDGTGSHVVLFSYYLILNVGIFIVAMIKPWRELNLLGFVFTYLIGSTWGNLYYNAEAFNTTEPFVVLFFIFYLLIPLRYAQQADAESHNSHQNNFQNNLQNHSKNNPKNNHHQQGHKDNPHQTYYKYKLNSALLFGTPLITLGLQVALLDNKTHLALSCVVMGLVYGVLALWLRYKTADIDLKDSIDLENSKEPESMLTTLQYAYTGLSAVFLTLAVPIGLSAKATTTIFALEGAGAVWLGAKANPRRRRILTWLSGGFLQLSSAVAFMVAYDDNLSLSVRYGEVTRQAIFNDFYLSGVLLAVAGWLCAWFSYRAVKNWDKQIAEKRVTQPKLAKSDGNNLSDSWLTNHTLTVFARLFFLAGMFWWLVISVCEICHVFYYDNNALYYILILLSITTYVLSKVYQYRKGYGDAVVWITAVVLLIVSGSIALIQFINVLFGVEMPLTWSIVSWTVYLICGVLVWRALQSIKSLLIESAIFIWLLAVSLTVSTLIYQLLPNDWQRNTGWHWGIIFVMWIIIAILDIFYPKVLAKLAKRPAPHQYDTPDSSQIDATNQPLSTWQKPIWQKATSWTVVSVLLFVFTITFNLQGSDGWWLPVFNSVDGLQIFLVFLMSAWLVPYRNNLLSLPSHYLLFIAMIISMSQRMLVHWSDWTYHKTNLFILTDWQWLMVFGFWTVLAVGLWMMLNHKLPLPVRLYKRLSTAIAPMLQILQTLLNGLMTILLGAWMLMLLLSGDMTPWIPLLNPLAILQVAIISIAWLWASGSWFYDDQPIQSELLTLSKRSLILTCMLLALISVMTLRFVYHYNDVELTWEASMFATPLVQMAFTVVWSILGVVGWIVGSRRASKEIWLLGAVLMTVVLVKLIFIDREHLGDLFGITSFFAYGVLCVIVGYFAPMPSFKESIETTDSEPIESGD